MSKLFPLTSKKPALHFAVSYGMTRILYIINPLITSRLINNAVNGNGKGFVQSAVLLAVIYVTTQLFDFLSDYSEENCYANAFENLVNLIRTKINYLDYRVNQISISELNQIMGQDFEKANKYLCVAKIKLFSYIIMIIVIFGIMISYSLRISLILIALLIILIPLDFRCSQGISDRSEKSLQSMSDVKNILNDHVILEKEDRFQNKKQITELLYTRYIDRFKNAFKKNNVKKSFYLNIVSYGILNGVIGLSIVVCAYFLLNKSIEIGTLYLFHSYTSQLFSPGEYIFEYYAKKKEMAPILEKFKQIDDLKTINDSSNKRISSITLSEYIGTGKNGEKLHAAIDFTFEDNNAYLITVDNGVGKTTLIENILHLTARYQGTILYNHEFEYIRDFTYVPSYPYISKYYSDKMTRASDGQKKLWQIKKDVQDANHVIIFDEPTNYLDKVNQKDVLDFILNLKQDHIVLVISHDPVFKDNTDFIGLHILSK